MLELSIIGLLTAFGAGVVSFLSPCVLPLVPGYVSFVAGSSLDDLAAGRRSRLQVLRLAGLFVIGFSLIFVTLGVSATALGQVLLTYRYELGVVAGIVVILFGLHMIGLTPFAWMNSDTRFNDFEMNRGGTLSALLLGVAFAFGWTPCISPVLGTILAWGASTADIGKATTLLVAYSLGLGLPFLLAALFTGALLQRMRSLGRMGRSLQVISGGLLLIMGLLMVTDQLQVIAAWLIETFPTLATIG